MENKPKSVWDDISKTWGRISAVIAAVGIIATFLVKMFNTPPEFTYIVFGCLGLVLLIVSFYVDRQAQYTYQDLDKCKKEVKSEFTEAMEETRRQFQLHSDEANERFNMIVGITKDTRKDTLRIQLMMLIYNQPENVDSILKVAETYFVDLDGDWYMTNEFSKWAKAHDVTVPHNITKALDSHK